MRPPSLRVVAMGAGLIALVMAVVWWVYSVPDVKEATVPSPAPTTTTASTARDATSGVAIQGATHPFSARSSGGILSRTAKEMLLSNEPALIEYSLMTLPNSCISLMTTEDTWMQTADRDMRARKDGGDPSAGTASLATRLGAYRLSREQCAAWYPDGLPDDHFLNRVRMTEGFKTMRTLRVNLRAADLDTAQGRSSLKDAMDASLLLAVKMLVMDRLDIERTLAGVPERSAFDVAVFMSEVITCRMGEDCGPNSRKALDLCWQAAICGGDYETAYLNHLKVSGMDAEQFSQAVTDLHQRLQKGDTSLLRSKPREPVN